MARPLRIEYPGAYYHVMNRGNAGQRVFGGNKEREKFLEYLGKAADRYFTKIHTYCLMSNHYHLLIETPEPNLSTTIQWLNVSYAAYYNKKHDRRGHLFQGRYKAILIEADEYLTELSRYIHLNPVRASMVKEPAEYQWSSYPAYIGAKKEPKCLQTEGVLKYFGLKKKEAKKNYRKFVEEIDIDKLENPNKHIVGGVILGDVGFVEWVKETFLSERGDEKEIPQLRELSPRPSIEKILKIIRDELGCSKEEILERDRKRNICREIAIYVTRDMSGLKCKEMGKYFGGISGAAITMSYKKMAKEIAMNRKLERKVRKIIRRIFNI